jgi:hypothetical protein
MHEQDKIYESINKEKKAKCKYLNTSNQINHIKPNPKLSKIENPQWSHHLVWLLFISKC